MSGSWEAEAILGNPEVDFEVGVASGPVVGLVDSEYSLEEEPGPFVGGPAGAWVVNAATVKRGTLEASVDFLQFLSANWGHAVKGRPGLVPVIKDVEPNVRPEVAEPAKAHIPTSVMRWSYADMVDAGRTRRSVHHLARVLTSDQITIDEAAERNAEGLGGVGRPCHRDEQRRKRRLVGSEQVVSGGGPKGAFQGGLRRRWER